MRSKYLPRNIVLAQQEFFNLVFYTIELVVGHFITPIDEFIAIRGICKKLGRSLYNYLVLHLEIARQVQGSANPLGASGKK